MGGILTLLALFTIKQEGESAVSSVSPKKETASAQTPATTAKIQKSESAVSVESLSLASNTSLFAYIPKPANAAKVEAEFAAPSQDIHYVRIDPLVAGEHSPLSRVGGRVEFTLPNGTKLPLIVKNTESFGDARFVSDGEIDGAAGHATFAYNNGELSGTIEVNDGTTYQVRAIGGSVAQVFSEDSNLVPPCGVIGAVHQTQADRPAAGVTVTANETAAAGTASGDVEAAGDIPTVSGVLSPSVSSSLSTKSTIRVLVPYSTTITKTISTSAVISAIDLAVANMNTDLQRSAVPVKVVLAGTVAETYTYDGKDPSATAIDNALTRITNPSDNVLDHVHAVRYDDQADLVCFLINEIDSTNSGVGYILATPNYAFNCTYGFSVISFSYLNMARTFSHELGHNLGCDHDRAHANSTSGAAAKGTYAYSYGYQFYGKNGVQYRDIMAYPPGQVVAYFSNPNLTVPSPISVPVGAPVGSSNQAYNALTITQNAAEVAAYHTKSLVSRAAMMTRTKS
ncbi:MAG TPA: M12 family metallo-peptidase [Opitutaceae bacterium]